jgi:glutaryl-CoA dehydrogenase
MSPHSDLYDLFQTLDPDQRRRWLHMRGELERRIAPIADAAWLEGRFPMEAVSVFQDLAPTFIPEGFAWPPADPLFAGLIKLELGRIDPSMASFFGVHWGLATASIEVMGSPEQKARWIPPMSRFEQIGSFALSEPLSGSDAAMGLRCHARRQGDGWLLSGQKKWSGNATFADVTVVIARTDTPGEMLGFLVERGTPGFEVELLGGKIAKRSVENVLITLRDCVLPEGARLPGLRRFSDVARALAIGRYAVAWEATGIAMGAFEAAHRYALERSQFGKPIAHFQLVQDKLVRMSAEITAMQCLCFRLATLAEEGRLNACRPALAKLVCAGGMRRVVALARELLGGNGILLEHGVARLFADAEAVYSYEGTQDINTLIVGRHLTGQSAFV